MAEIKLSSGESAYIDDRDLKLVNKSGCKSWYSFQGSNGVIYVRGRIGKEQIFLHWLIAGYKNVDHIDHDGLNNRRSNLRPANKSKNGMNRRKASGTSSQYKGVSWYKAGNKWRAMIMLNKKAKHLGYFLEEIEAAKAYDKAARELFGEYALTNFRDPGYLVRGQNGRTPYRHPKDTSVHEKDRRSSPKL